MAGSTAWRKIADDLQRRIEAGEFNVVPSGNSEDTFTPSDAPEDGNRPKLPTELTLQEHYGASRNTIRDAIRWLTDLRIVQPEAGRGTFVLVKRDPFHVTLSARGEAWAGGGEGSAYLHEAHVQDRESVNSEPRVEIQKAPAKVARQLGVPTGSQIVLRSQQRFIDDQPWSLVTSYYPWSFVELGATRLVQAEDFAVMEYLAQTLGRRQVGYHDSISGRMPNPAEALFFGLPERGTVAVFETFRTAYDQDGKPCRLTIAVWPIDRNRLHFNTGTVPADVIESPSGRRPPTRP